MIHVDDVLVNGRDNGLGDRIGSSLNIGLHGSAVALQIVKVKGLDSVLFHFFFLFFFDSSENFKDSSLFLCLFDLGRFGFDVRLQLDTLVDGLLIVSLYPLFKSGESVFQLDQFGFKTHNRLPPMP